KILLLNKMDNSSQSSQEFMPLDYSYNKSKAYKYALVLAEFENDPWNDFSIEDIPILQEISDEEIGNEYTKEILAIKTKQITPCIIIDNDYGKIQYCNRESVKGLQELTGIWEIDKNTMDIDENDTRKKKKRKITPNMIIDTFILLEAKEMELLFEESGQLAQILSNQLIILSVAKIKTDLYSLPQPAAIYIKFLSENPYLAQQQFVDSHKWTQVIDDILAQQKTSKNNALNLEQLNEDNSKGVSELDKHTRSKIERKKEDRMETTSNIIIDREDATKETEAKKISYSKTIGRHQRKRTNRIIECKVDNG
ncbi:25370_t:CDS:2, partial [Gigaspora margarita]